MRSFFLVIFVLAGTALGAQDTTKSSSVQSRPSSPLSQGDVVRVKVWGEESLSGDATVDNDGKAAFPRIGNVQVTNIPSDSVRRLITNTYSQWLVKPAIEVTFLRRLRVFGAVHNPNTYTLEEGRTIADAVAMAGGVSEDGSYDHVQLVHEGSHDPINVTRVTRLADLDVRSGDEVYVPQRSWVSRNSGTLVASVITALALVAGSIIR